MMGYLVFGNDDNPLALVYSIFLSLWSTLFLQSWNQLEHELAFRWGSEGYETTEQPRPQFRGRFLRNPQTGGEKLVHKDGASKARRTGRMIFAWSCGCCMIFGTGMAAMNAYLVRELYREIPKLSLSMMGPVAAVSSDDDDGSGSSAGEFTSNATAHWNITSTSTSPTSSGGGAAAAAAASFEKDPDVKKRYQLMSTGCSLIVIQIASRLYKPIAVYLCVDLCTCLPVSLPPHVLLSTYESSS